MNHLELGFLIGLLGSLHCVGMCGPLAFAISAKSKLTWIIAAEKLSYNLGRVVSYGLLGLLIGVIGKQLWIAGFQQAISIISGILIVMAALTRLFPLLSAKFPNWSRHLFNPVQQLIIKTIDKKGGHFLIGILNGLLPCGFVYLALAAAINTSNILQSSLFMVFFGLGTIPLMLAATLGISFVSPVIRHRINKTLPVLMLILGFWFIIRGLNLGIPYLSPVLMSQEVICH